MSEKSEIEKLEQQLKILKSHLMSRFVSNKEGIEMKIKELIEKINILRTQQLHSMSMYNMLEPLNSDNDTPQQPNPEQLLIYDMMHEPLVSSDEEKTPPSVENRPRSDFYKSSESSKSSGVDYQKNYGFNLITGIYRNKILDPSINNKDEKIADIQKGINICNRRLKDNSLDENEKGQYHAYLEFLKTLLDDTKGGNILKINKILILVIIISIIIIIYLFYIINYNYNNYYNNYNNFNNYYNN
jgi:hypothetical protein